jgi:hypothetical protein
MIARDALVAGVLAATDRVVQQANVGDWPAALKSSQDRRALLEQLVNQEPQSGEHGFLRALRDAAAESDAALATMSGPIPAQGAVGGRLCTKA